MRRTVSCLIVLLSVLVGVATVLPSHASTLDAARDALGERYGLSRIDIQNPRTEGDIAGRGVVSTTMTSAAVMTARRRTDLTSWGTAGRSRP